MQLNKENPRNPLDLLRHNLLRHNLLRHNLLRHNLLRHNLLRVDESRVDLVPYLQKFNSVKHVHHNVYFLQTEHEIVKLLPKNNRKSLKEAIALQKLQSIYVVKRLKCVITEDYYVIHMDFYASTLHDKLISGENINRVTLKRYTRQLLEAVCHCHENGWAHMDIKPANVMVNHKDNLHLGDFGLAFKGERRKAYVGTKSYMAPEVKLARYHILNDLEYSYDAKKSDVYSTGLVLLKLHLRNRMGRVTNRAINEFKEGKYQKGSWEELLKAMLREDPDKRLSIEKCMRHRYVKLFL
jgi:serine/threonine protein kinase